MIIAYHYPPVAGSSGVQRTLKFTAYLRDHGWEPMVLTVSPRAYEGVTDGQLAEIPEGMLVERAFALDSSRHLSWRGRYLRLSAIPDRWASWWPAAVWRGMAMIRKYQPEVIMSTFPIATAHMVGLTLRRLSGLPWVADFRDNMTDPDYPRDPITWRFNRWLEGATVRHCTRAVFTTRGTLQMYAERYPAVPKDHWAIVENGFDEENFLDATRTLPERKVTDDPQPLIIVHSGVLYPEERDPRPFFAAVKQLKAAGQIDAGSLRIVLRATGSDAHYAEVLSTANIDDIVHLAPPVGYRQALQEMLTADGLLLFQASMCNHQIPAKLYEYMRAGRPILALTDAIGDTANVLQGAQTGVIADLRSSDDIAARLGEFVASLKAGRAQGTLSERAALHSRRARTAELARLFDSICQVRRQ